jgi:hypothetical protein
MTEYIYAKAQMIRTTHALGFTMLGDGQEVDQCQCLSTFKVQYIIVYPYTLLVIESVHKFTYYAVKRRSFIVTVFVL